MPNKSSGLKRKMSIPLLYILATKTGPSRYPLSVCRTVNGFLIPRPAKRKFWPAALGLMNLIPLRFVKRMYWPNGNMPAPIMMVRMSCAMLNIWSANLARKMVYTGPQPSASRKAPLGRWPRRRRPRDISREYTSPKARILLMAIIFVS